MRSVATCKRDSIHWSNKKDVERYVYGYIFTQMSKGIQKHRDVAIKALVKEFLQLHQKDAFEAIRAATLTNKQKRQHYVLSI